MVGLDWFDQGCVFVCRLDPLPEATSNCHFVVPMLGENNDACSGILR